MNSHTIYDLALAFEENISAAEKVALFEYYGDSETIFNGKVSFYSKQGKKIKVHKTSLAKAEYINDFIGKSGINTFMFNENDYPYMLTNTHDKPFMIFTRGDVSLLQTKSVSIVGTRHPAVSALKLTELITALLVRKNYTIVSGLAKGIDTEAHTTAMCLSGKTVGILGSGIDTIYPAASLPVVKNMLSQKNLVISEYPPGVAPYKFHFPQRNRIIAGLSGLTILIQAPEKSGSLITARMTLDYNRDLLVYKPYEYDIRFHGNISLIDEYTANCFSGMEDFMNYLENEMPA